MDASGNSMVFVHGAGSSADFWHLQRAAFPEAHFVNLPGHGWQYAGSMVKAVIGSGKESIGEYADWLVGYVEEKRMEGVVLDGHSMGGAVALEVALRKPGWLRGIVLTCAGARFAVAPELMRLLEEDFAAGIDLIVEESFGMVEGEGGPTYKQKAMRYGTKKQMMRTSQDVVLGDYRASIGFDVRDRLGEIAVPALMMVGAEDKVTRVELSRELHQGIDGSRLAVVERAGHMLPMEKADEYNGIVKEFIEGLEG